MPTKGAEAIKKRDVKPVRAVGNLALKMHGPARGLGGENFRKNNVQDLGPSWS